MTGIIFMMLAGLAAAGFLALVWQHRKMPTLLRAALIIVAIATVIYVGWGVVAVLTAR